MHFDLPIHKSMWNQNKLLHRIMLIQTLRKEVDSDLEKRENHLEANSKNEKWPSEQFKI